MIGRMSGVARTIAGLALAAALAIPPALAAVPSSEGAFPVTTHMETSGGAHLLTLESVIERARHHHPDILKAEAALVAAERELEAQEAAYTPRVSLESTPLSLRMQQGQLTRQSASVRLSANQSTPTGLSASASVSLAVDDDFALSVPTWSVGLSYPLFRSAELNATNMAIRQAEIGLEVARRNRVRSEATALVQTVELYHSAYLASLRLQEARETLAEVQEQTDSVLRQVELGIVSEVDRISALTELRRQELAEAQAERAYRDQMQSLLTAIGLTGPPDAYELAGWPKLTPPARYLVPEGWADAARAFDASLWQREVAIETALLQLRAERERSGVESGLSASVGKGQTNDPSSDSTTRWSVQLQVSYPLADGGARAKGLEEREESVRDAEQAYRDELKAFEQRTRQLQEAVSDARIQVEIAELTYEKAKIEFANAQAAYAGGMSGHLNLRQAERALRRADDDLQAAVLDMWVAVWNIEIAAGNQPNLSMLFVPRS